MKTKKYSFVPKKKKKKNNPLEMLGSKSIANILGSYSLCGTGELHSYKRILH